MDERPRTGGRRGAGHSNGVRSAREDVRRLDLLVKLTDDEARARLAAHVHGVCCTVHPDRGPDPTPVVYALDDDGFVGIPIDSVKPKTSSRLQRERNLEADPRAALLVEHWDSADWTRLWWVRGDLRREDQPSAARVDGLAARLARTVPQYADQPFHRVLVLRLVDVTGWAAGGE
jgi:hypothetical protein